MADGLQKYLDVLGPGDGDPTKPKSTKSSKTPSLADYEKVLDAPRTGGDPFLQSNTSQYNPEEYDFNLKYGQDNNKLRAQNQGWILQTGKTLGNLLPNIVLGLAESVGYLGSLVTEWGDDRDYSNWLTDLAQSGKNKLFGEVYRENPEDVWSMGDYAWWTNNIGSLAESVASFAVIGAGAGAAFGKGAAALTRLASLEGLGAQALKAGAQGLTAATLAYTEGAMSGYQVYNKAYDTQYRKAIRAGLDPLEADAQARHMGAQAASTTVQLNTAINTALNVPQLNMLFKSNDEILNWMRAEGRASSSLTEFGERLGRGMKSRGWTHAGIEALSEGTEEMVNQFAERTGEAVGQGKAKSGFVEQFGELSNFFDRTLDAEGGLNFALGAFGGVAQGVVLNNIPFHKEIQRDAQGNALPKLDARGEIVDGKYQVKYVTSRAREENGRNTYYANVRDAVLKDITWMQDKQQELADAILAKNTVKAQDIRNEVLSTHLSSAIGLGMTDAFKNEYRKIAEIDNSTLLSEPYIKQAQDLEVQKHEILSQSSDGTINGLPEEFKTAYAELDAQQKQAIKQADDLAGQTAATQAGYAQNKDDNAYKQKANEQIQNLTTFQKMYDDLQSRFIGRDDAEAANVAGAVLIRKINNHLKAQNIASQEAILNGITADTLQQAQQLMSYNPLLDNLLLERNKNEDAYYNIQKERLELDKARAELVKQVEKNKGQVPANSRLAKMLGRYKINGFDNTMKSLGGAYSLLENRLREMQDSYKNKATAAEQSIESSEDFNKWINTEVNKSKGLYGFLADLANRPKDVATLLSNRSDLRELTQRLEQTKAELQISIEQLAELESTKGIDNFIKAVLNDIDKVAAAEDASIRAENNAIEKTIRDQQAAINLTNHQSTFLVDKNNADIRELERQIATEEEALQGHLTKVQEERSQKGWKAKLRNRLMTTEAEANVKYSRSRIALLQDKIRVLDEQNYELLNGRAEVAVTPEEEILVPEEVVTEEEVVADVTEEVTPDADTTPEPVILDRSFSDIISDAAVNDFQTFINSYPDGTANLSLEDAYKEFSKIARSHNLSYTKEEEMRVISPYIQNVWINKVNATPVDDSSPELAAQKEFKDILESIDPDDADFILSVLEPVLEGKIADNWKLLDGEVQLGILTANTAARLIQLAETIAADGAGYNTADSTFAAEKEEDTTQEDPFAGVDMEELLTPDKNDVAEEEGDQAEELTVDLPEVEISEDLPVRTLPDGSVNDPAVLEDSRFHSGKKIIDALSIANMTLEYEESTDGLSYIIETSSNKINPNTAPEVLKVGGIKVGDKIRLVVDDTYRGPINNTSMEGTKQDSFEYYTDENGKIVGNANVIGNVPIKIIHEKSGAEIGYLRRSDWVTARYKGAADFRNVADEYGPADNRVVNNVADQRRRLLAARTKVVEMYNANGGFVTTTVSDRGPGTVMLTVGKNAEGKNEVVFQLGTKALPDKSLELGIASGGTIKVGKNSVFEGTINTSDFSPYDNVLFAMLPMPDGSFSLGRMDNLPLNDKSRKLDIDTAINAIEVYITQNEALAQQYEDASGFDILSDDGIRSFIRQHYTYLNGFNSAVLAANAPILEGQSRKIEFLFNITNRVNGPTGEVSIGWSYSGKPKLTATVGADGKLNKQFRDELAKGLSIRFKNVVLTDSQYGIKGLNSVDEINEVVWDKKNGKVKVRKVHANYNEYVKSFTQSPVNGTNQLSDGSYVYSANPQNIMDLNEIQRTIVSQAANVEPDAAALEDNTDQVTEDVDLSLLTEEERALIFGQDGGFMGMKVSYIEPSPSGNIDGGKVVSLQNLQELHTFTPVNKRNGKTPEEVLYELSQLGIKEIAPGFNPFYKC